MNKSYKRMENIDEKIQQIRLSYNGWRTLFLIDEETSTEKIAEILKEDAELIDTEIQNLLEAELISETVQEDAEPQKAAEESVEEILQEEPRSEEQIETEPAEEETPVSEIPDVVELEEEENQPAEDQAADEEIAIEEAEPETIADEDLEINIHDEDSTESEMLDVDFAEETPEEQPQEAESQPAEKEQQEPDTPPASAPEPVQEADGNNIVLVIDDSIVIRKMVEIALENEDLVIQTAVSGKDGLDKIDQLNPSLLILDLMLPDINGIDILKTVKASRNIPVIMLSGKDSPQMVEKAKEAGADAFLPKPFKDDELKEQIKTLLEA